MISNTSRANVAKRVLRTKAAARRSTSTISRGGRRLNRSAAAISRSQWRVSSAEYSTEQVLKLRGSTADAAKTLYDASAEKDNCGVGLIANLKSKPSRHVVEVADEMLVRMSHRGGVGCDPCSGDGAGKCFQSILSVASLPANRHNSDGFSSRYAFWYAR